MEVKITTDELRKRKIFVATPMYGGQCHGMYTKSSLDLIGLTHSYGMDLKSFFLFNESLITRARNYCADEFMRSDYTHLMFIDSDISFNPNDVLTLATLMDPNDHSEERKEIMCGPYPKKCISWEKIKRAVEKGFAENNPQELERYVGDYVFNPAQGQKQVKISEPCTVLEGGTGFMMIQRSAFEKFNSTYPEYSYYPDHARTKHFDGSRKIMMYFQALIDNKQSNMMNEIREFFKQMPDATPDDTLKFLLDEGHSVDGSTYSERYLSEDYMFCQWMRKAGVETWMCPWMQMTHVGTYNFSGSLSDLAQIGAAATADENAIQRMKV